MVSIVGAQSINAHNYSYVHFLMQYFQSLAAFRVIRFNLSGIALFSNAIKGASFSRSFTGKKKMVQYARGFPLLPRLGQRGVKTNFGFKKKQTAIRTRPMH